MITRFDQGDLVRVSATFTDVGTGLAADPTSVFFDWVEESDGTVTQLIYGTDADLVKDSTGNYHVDINTSTIGGIVTWRFYSTGTDQYSATEDSFYVRPSSVVATILAAQPTVTTQFAILGTANQVAVAGGAQTVSTQNVTLSIPASAQLSVAKLTNLTTNGLVKTGSGDGTLSVATLPIGTYTATNVSTDRSYDANATSTDELADVLGTLIADLRTAGIVA